MALVRELRNEQIQHLDFLWIARRFEAFYSTNLNRINFYSMVSNHISKELASPHLRSALVSVETQLVSLEYFKHFLKIIDMPLLLFTLHHHILNIYLHYTPNLISKHPCHHLLISSPTILQTKWHHSVMIGSIEKNEHCLFLILDNQGNLMVTLKSI